MIHQRCSRCERAVPAHELTHVSSSGERQGALCGRCWADVLSQKWGTDVQAVEIDPISMDDVAGEAHTFHFRFDPTFRILSAFELVDGRPGGRQFAVRPVDDEPDEPVASLLGRLLTKMRRWLATVQIEPCSIVHGGYSLVGSTVRGRVEFDAERDRDPRLPVVVVDGRTFSWEEFGAMVMSHEG